MVGNKDFTANKCIVCVRNPFDIIISCYNFYNSNFAHSATLINDPFIPENAAHLNNLISTTIDELNKMMKYVYEALIKDEVPFYFLKFE